MVQESMEIKRRKLKNESDSDEEDDDEDEVDGGTMVKINQGSTSTMKQNDTSLESISGKCFRSNYIKLNFLHS